MKARLWLAEAGTVHPDRTVSLLRAGIDRFRGDTLPIPCQAVLAARFDAGIVDRGEHRYDLGCMDEDGKVVMQRVRGVFSTPEGGAPYHYMFSLSLALPRYGPYVFFVRIDNVELDSWTVRATPTPQRGSLE